MTKRKRDDYPDYPDWMYTVAALALLVCLCAWGIAIPILMHIASGGQ